MEKLFDKLFSVNVNSGQPNVPREQAVAAFTQLFPKLMPKPENAA
jgi:hypothetical protein